MKNSFEISKGIFTSKLKDNFLKFLLLVKELKFMTYKKVENQSTIGRIISNLIKKQYCKNL